MTGETIINLDTFFNLKYIELQRYCKDKKIPEDNVHEVYLKLRSNIYKTGMTITQYNQYIRKSLYNLMLDEKKSLKYRSELRLPYSRELKNEIETVLQRQKAEEESTKAYYDEIEWLTKMLFRFIDVKKFNEYELFIFKSYFLVPKMTYKKLNDNTGVSMDKIQLTIRKFKSEIKDNFILWLNNGEERN